MKKVVVLGGGVAGLSAAHELIERGFAVEVYEAMEIPGGKARSIPVTQPLDRSGKAAPCEGKPLPGEHGFRFFPRFYKHIVDTMSRIPCGNGRVCSDNLVDTTRVEMARYGKAPVVFPTRSPRTIGDVQVMLGDACVLLSEELGIPREDMAFFVTRIWQIITSCYERRTYEYEKIGWWEFIEADKRSLAYQRFMGYGITRSLVAAKAQLASTKTIGDIFVQLLFDIVRPGTSSDRLLNGPTNDVWIDPWVDYLTQRGVKYHLGSRVKEIHCVDGQIHGATIEQGKRSFTVHGDYYIAAVPVERMVPLLTPTMVAADPGLARLATLAGKGVDWMIGIQLYLTKDVRINNGHTLYLDSQWALTSVSQRQFWSDVDFSQYADGRIQGILSVDVSEWNAVGLCGKTAKQCTVEEIKNEVWEQLKRSVNVNGQVLLRDEYLHDFYMPPDLYRSAGGIEKNEEPLLVNLIDTWGLRPEAKTKIPNLFLASDYVRTYTDLATMEGANEAARWAVNGILEHSQSEAAPCAIWHLQEPDLFDAWRALDRLRYYQGLPWDDSLAQLVLAATNLSGMALRALEQGIGMQAGAMLSGLAQPTTPLGDATQAAYNAPSPFSLMPTLTPGNPSPFNLPPTHVMPTNLTAGNPSPFNLTPTHVMPTNLTPGNPSPFNMDKINAAILTQIANAIEMLLKPQAMAISQLSDITVPATVPEPPPPAQGGRVRIVPQ